jgi:hypothetical protein
MNKDIKQTVGVPCFNAKKAGFLAMEGLVAQKGIDWNWELLVIEEQNEDMLGEQFFDSYRKKLLSVNCVRIEYIKLSLWMPLGQKWKVLGEAASRTSISFLLQGVDDFSFDTRLAVSQKLIEEGADWVDFTRGYFYSFVSNKVMLYDAAKNPLITNLNMAIRSSLMRGLPDTDRRIAVDMYLHKHIASIKPKYICRHIDTLFDSGFDSDGYNLLSKRLEHYYNPEPPFYGSELTISNLRVPLHVRDWIVNNQVQLKKPTLPTRSEVMLMERIKRKREQVKEKKHRAGQMYISKSVESFKKEFSSRYNLAPYSSKTKPLVIFGMYRDEDYVVYQRHRGGIIVVWCGSDGMQITKKRKRIIKSQPRARHIVTSIYTAKDLSVSGIPYIIRPITPAPNIIDLQPRGDNLYCYTGNDPAFYNKALAEEVGVRTGLKVIYADCNTYSKQELWEVYKSCFMGLRLTLHDGVPTTVIELALMGRRSAFNGGIPGSIPWRNIDDLCETVLKEFELRHQPNDDIAKSMYDYLNIDNSWLRM